MASLSWITLGNAESLRCTIGAPDAEIDELAEQPELKSTEAREGVGQEEFPTMADESADSSLEGDDVDSYLADDEKDGNSNVPEVITD